MAVKTEYKGANVEEAINNACQQLGLSRDNLDIEIISAGSAGIFGLCKRKAVISVIPKADQTDTETQEPTVSKKHRSKPVKNNFSSPLASPVAPAPEIISEVKDTLQKMLDLMDIEAEVEAELDDKNRIKSQIICNDESSIIGREGETINALQYLLRKIISHKYPQKIFFSIDIGNYRERRRKHLEDHARAMAAKVKETGKKQIIKALNPAERRFVHVALQDDKEIRSVSIGDGLFKKIKIYIPGKSRQKNNRRAARNV